MVKEKSRRKGQKGRESVRIMNTLGIQRFAQCDMPEELGTVCSIAVEGQNVTYTAGKGANPQHIVDLAGTAGAILAVLSAFNPAADTYLPAPSEWKGTIPKSVHQCRMISNVGMKYEKKGGQNTYPVPWRDQWIGKVMGPDKINDGDWQDIADSVGLALYARDQFYKKLKRNKNN